MTNNQISEKLDEMRSSLSKISEKLQSHLEVAEFVDKSSKKDIEELSKGYKEITKRLIAVETEIVLIKNEKKSKKELIIVMFKIVGLICVVIGASYTLNKMGIINGPGINR